MERERFICGIRKTGTYLRKLSFFVPPVLVLLAMLLLFRLNGLYPFGTKTLSWCDMDQQVVPLLVDFKDILCGKDGFFLNMKNAAGMNFFGVFFFFLSSPFSLLVVFVEKSDMLAFANILIVLKMCTISCTASIYFKKKHPNHAILNVALSILYAFSGYTMLYYQNVIWLDIVYLFPLLLLGLERLKEGKKTLFVCILAACVIVNYYLSYMLVVFLILYVGIWLLLSKERAFAKDFTVSCVLAALLSSVVWLPSLIQYFSSGRTTSVLENLRSSSIFTALPTTLPTMFSVLFLFPFAFLAKKEDKDNRLRRILFGLTLVPIVLEPINKMWQTGSYMSFPTRYGFIPVFLCLTLAMDAFSVRRESVETSNARPFDLQNCRKKIGLVFKENRKKELPRYALSIAALVLAVGYALFAKAYTKANADVMDQYSQSLWGNEASLEALLKLYAVALLLGAVWCVLYKWKLFKPVFLWLCVAVMAFSEIYVAPMTYMLTPAHDVVWYREVMELADKIEDEDFYRVKTDQSYAGHDFDVNLMASLGYNGLGHYTSLTAHNYMTAIKQFGYTSYWMEVGNSGGTILTDALLSIKYQIQRQSNGTSSVYEGSYFEIDELPYTLPLGIISREDVIAEADTEDYSRRAVFQTQLYGDFFDGNAVTAYGLERADCKNLTVTEENGKYVLTPSGIGSIVFTVPIDETTTLYFNAFDENTNALNQKINGKFFIEAPKKNISGYPQQRENGLACLGEYGTAYKTVTVRVQIKKKVTVRDLGLVAIRNESLERELGDVKTVGLQTSKNKIFGSYDAQGGECVFLSVPYNDGMLLKINGKTERLYEVYDGFTAFRLRSGENKIEITYRPKGFTTGFGVTIFTVAGCATLAALWIWKGYRLRLPKGCESIAYFVWLAAFGAVLLAVYVAPLLLCAIG